MAITAEGNASVGSADCEGGGLEQRLVWRCWSLMNDQSKSPDKTEINKSIALAIAEGRLTVTQLYGLQTSRKQL